MQVYHAAFDHIATKFFSLPNYCASSMLCTPGGCVWFGGLRTPTPMRFSADTLPTKQADGTVKECVLFAWYILPNMLASLGQDAALAEFAFLRNRTVCLKAPQAFITLRMMKLQPFTQYRSIILARKPLY